MRTSPLRAAAFVAVAWLVPARPAHADGPTTFADVTPGAVHARVEGWERDLGEGTIRTPAFHGGRLFVGDGLSGGRLAALDARTGDVVWSTTLSDTGPTPLSVLEGRIVVGTESCDVHVLDEETGSLVWERVLGDPIHAAPAVAGGRIYTVHAADGGWKLTALSLRDGVTLWSQPIGGDAVGAVVADGDEVLVTTDGGEVIALDAARGRLRWRASVGAAGPPAVAGDDVDVIVGARAGHHATFQVNVTFPLDEGEDAPHVLAKLEDAGGTLDDCGWYGHAELGAHVAGGSVRALSVDDAELRRCLARALGPVVRVGPRDGEGAAWLVRLDSRVEHGAQRVVRVDRRNGATRGVVATGDFLRDDARVAHTGWEGDGERPTVANGVAVEVLGDLLQARRVTDGAVLWKQPLDAPSTLAAVAGSVVVHGLANGRLVVRDRATGRVLRAVDVGAPITAQPIVADGFVYAVTDDGRVVGVALPETRGATYAMWGGSPAH